MLERIEGCPASAVTVEPLAGDRAPTELKRIGYGVPMLVRYAAGGRERKLVFRTQSPNWFGHDRRSDRACLALLAADTYADQPGHVQVLDVGAIRPDDLVSLAGTGEMYLATTYVEGELYARDLRRIETDRHANPGDVERAMALAKYLARLHASPLVDPEPNRYVRSIRDLVGSGEGIFGLVDSYPNDFGALDLLRRIEQLALDWRWRLGRGDASAMRRVHGDFHPYNVLFRKGVDFTMLDASRGGVGDAADDLAAMAINYAFGGLRQPLAWMRGFKLLWDAFFATYLVETGDSDVLGRMPPFLAWRALVLASPIWYPDIEMAVRVHLLEGAINWMNAARFDPRSVESMVTRWHPGRSPS